MDDGTEAARKLERLAAALDAGLSDSVLLDAGNLALQLVLGRTKQGIDVDGNQFKPYSEEYAKERAARGLSTKPDLAVTGHMLGAPVPKITGKNEVSIMFLSQQEAVKDAAHNTGVNKNVSVRPHSRSAYVNAKTGRRVSDREARLDARRKNKRVAQRVEQVKPHTRKMNVPKREHMGIRMKRELDMIGKVLGDGYAAQVIKGVK